MVDNYFPSDTLHGRSTRAPATGRRGMVAAGHPCATQAGLDVLKEGGNAFDAAVAVAATLNVVEPYMSGMGGIGIALTYSANDGRSRVLDFSGRSASAATPDAYTAKTQAMGARAPLVPGNVAGWTTLQAAYGKLPLRRCFRDAIDYAEYGFPFTPFNAAMFAANWGFLAEFGALSSQFLGGLKTPPQLGALFRQPALARSLSAVAEGGAKAFYEGDIADRIVSCMQRNNGLITQQDLSAYCATWQEPLSVNYRGHDVRVPPPNSSGFQLAETLNILDGCMPLACGTEDSLHCLIEAVKLAIEDRIAYGGDPEFSDIPITRLLSPEYANQQRNRISPRGVRALPAERFSESYRETKNWWRNGLTTHFATADTEGNVVTITQTLGNAFGAGVAPDDTGILLNNMSLWFDLETGPNRIGPNKRVDFCVAPCQVFRKGRLLLSIGTPGSYGILQTTAQILHHFIDAQMNIQEAIEAPRFRLQESGELSFEARFPAELLQGLKGRGHAIERLKTGWSKLVGGAHGIHVTDHGTFLGGADPRRDGIALGF